MKACNTTVHFESHFDRAIVWQIGKMHYSYTTK
jgi:hypothetical protein